jgi:hypothetical protein
MQKKKCYLSVILRRYGRGMWHVWWRGKLDTGFRWVDLTTIDHLEDSGKDGNIKKNGPSRNRM